MKDVRIGGLSIIEVIVIGFVVLMLFGGVFVQPYFEAQAYNRITGSNVSTWDAIWVQLRVNGCNGK